MLLWRRLGMLLALSRDLFAFCFALCRLDALLRLLLKAFPLPLTLPPFLS